MYLMLFLIGWPAYTYLDEVITGGIHDRGGFKEVDLKAAWEALSVADREAITAQVKAENPGLRRWKTMLEP